MCPAGAMTFGDGAGLAPSAFSNGLSPDLGPSNPLPMLPRPAQTFSPRACAELHATLNEKRSATKTGGRFLRRAGARSHRRPGSGDCHVHRQDRARGELHKGWRIPCERSCEGETATERQVQSQSSDRKWTCRLCVQATSTQRSAGPLITARGLPPDPMLHYAHQRLFLQRSCLRTRLQELTRYNPNRCTHSLFPI